MPARFAAAWQQVLARHEILRTGFAWDGALEAPVQIVHRGLDFQVQHHDARGGESDIAALAAAEHARGFDLMRPPLMRVLLVRTGDDRHHLIWTSHHLLLDGWSSARLIAEVIERYSGADAPITRPAGGRYRDYLAWLAEQDAAPGQRFWRERLRGLDQPTQLASTPGAAPAGRGAGAAPRSPGTGAGDGAGKMRAARAHHHQHGRAGRLGDLAGAAHRPGRRLLRPDGFGPSSRPARRRGAAGPVHQHRPGGGRPDRRPRAWPRGCAACRPRRWPARARAHAAVRDPGLGRAGRPAAVRQPVVFENYPVDRALRAGTGRLRFGALDSVEATNYPVTLSVSGGHGLELSLGFDRADRRSGAGPPGGPAGPAAGTDRRCARAAGDLQLAAASDHAAVAACNAGAGRAPRARPGAVHEQVRAQAAARPAGRGARVRGRAAELRDPRRPGGPARPRLARAGGGARGAGGRLPARDRRRWWWRCWR